MFEVVSLFEVLQNVVERHPFLLSSRLRSLELSNVSAVTCTASEKYEMCSILRSSDDGSHGLLPG